MGYVIINTGGDQRCFFSLEKKVITNKLIEIVKVLIKEEMNPCKVVLPLTIGEECKKIKMTESNINDINFDDHFYYGVNFSLFSEICDLL